MLYLAQPYSINASAQRMHERYLYGLKKTAEYTKLGLAIFSPIVSSHLMTLEHDMPCTWDFWQTVDKKFLDASSEVYCLMMQDWDKSVGVHAELCYARSIGIPIKYIECPDEFEVIEKVA